MHSPESARRNAMVQQILDDYSYEGALLSAPVEQALRRVPRELFLTGLDLADVYNAHKAVVTKRDEDKGVALSSVSAPSIIATMLDRADLQPGMRVLEIGSGGYNAALIAELVGSEGEVTTIDIDSDVIDRARRCLDTAGYPQVRTAVADGEYGFADRAPYDRVLVTAGAWDIPPAWTEQLASGGRMVVPMRVRGLTRCLTLDADEDGVLHSKHVDMCGFVRMQGAGEHWEPMPYLNDTPGQQIGLRLEDGPEVDAEALRKAMAETGTPVWSGVMVGVEEDASDQDLWVASVADRWALLTADQGAVDTGLVTPTWILGTPALVSPAGDSFAYRTLRQSPNENELWEFGAIGHGPTGTEMAEQLTDHIRSWDRQHRSGSGPEAVCYPRSTPADRLPAGRVVDKAHTRMVITWPSPTPEGD
ncbi:methyltransferase, FxLD system [Nocardiopsis sp. EMB25]|uniref:methyltransferase, FxLD system n=1 Tax=Nocardiopsis sp. EMB25 TaxID=2835867 RepID=UPI0022838AC7|nr:methyltransferase, FxLD system [Nocardiopsis sp. EMB25]MCY9783944.1 methyltransferase, FxLD system [Nocardiopsis sp. EMB25]